MQDVLAHDAQVGHRLLLDEELGELLFLGADSGGESLGTRLGGDDPSLDDAERRVTLSPLLAQLPPREQMILHLRFFEGLTQSEIAARLGISQMHVSRLLTRSMAQLRSAAGGRS